MYIYIYDGLGFSMLGASLVRRHAKAAPRTIAIARCACARRTSEFEARTAAADGAGARVPYAKALWHCQEAPAQAAACRNFGP